MQLIERVREIGTEESVVSEESVQTARRSLRHEIARRVRPVTTRRRGRAWAGLGVGALVAGTAVTTIVVGSVLAPPSASSASAAEVLNAAAETASDPVLAEGQYLEVSTTYQYVVHWDLSTQRPVFDRSEADATILVDQPIARYEPADAANDEWIVDRRPDAVAESWGDQAAVQQWQEQIGRASADVAGVSRYPGGIGHAQRDGAEGDPYYIDGRDFYEGMPADPAGIIEWWSTRYADEQDEGGYAHFFVETVTDLGTFNLAPASIRSAMLGAFASVDGMEVVRTDGSATTLRFDRGAKGRPSLLEFVLDTENGYILSVTDWGRAAPMEEEGAPRWHSRTTSHVEVVDSAP